MFSLLLCLPQFELWGCLKTNHNAIGNDENCHDRLQVHHRMHWLWWSGQIIDPRGQGGAGGCNHCHPRQFSNKPSGVMSCCISFDATSLKCLRCLKNAQKKSFNKNFMFSFQSSQTSALQPILSEQPDALLWIFEHPCDLSNEDD